jgi:hypothetical protein
LNSLTPRHRSPAEFVVLEILQHLPDPPSLNFHPGGLTFHPISIRLPQETSEDQNFTPANRNGLNVMRRRDDRILLSEEDEREFMLPENRARILFGANPDGAVTPTIPLA